MLLKDLINVIDKKTILHLKPIGYIASADDIAETPRFLKYNLLELEITTIKPCDFNAIIIILNFEV